MEKGKRQYIVSVDCASSKVVDLDSVKTPNGRGHRARIYCFFSEIHRVYMETRLFDLIDLRTGRRLYRFAENVRSWRQTTKRKTIESKTIELSQTNSHRVYFTKSSQTKSHHLFHEIFISFSAFLIICHHRVKSLNHT